MSAVTLEPARTSIGQRRGKYSGNHENMPVEKAVELNIQSLEKMKERVARLPHERILECHLRPAEHRGELEEILIANL